MAKNAVGQGRETVGEARRQARNLMDKTSSQLMEQADAQQKRAAAQLRTLGDELASMSGRDEQHGMAGDLTRQAADQAHRAADWLDQRQPGAVLDELREFARRSPGIFLAGAAVAGMLAGRLSRNLAASDGAGTNASAGTYDTGAGAYDGAGAYGGAGRIQPTPGTEQTRGVRR